MLYRLSKHFHLLSNIIYNLNPCQLKCHSYFICFKYNLNTLCTYYTRFAIIIFLISGHYFCKLSQCAAVLASAWFAQFTGTQLVDAGFWLLRLKINGALFSTHAAHMHKWHSGRKNHNKTTNHSFNF